MKKNKIKSVSNEHDTAKELINEATNKMAAAVERNNMQSVKVAQMMLKAGNEKCRIQQRNWTQFALNKEISENDHDMKDVLPAKKMKP